MSNSPSGGLTQPGLVGIGVGVGSLLLVTATVVAVKIYLRHREHSRAIAEIEQGFGRAVVRPDETSEVLGQRHQLRRGVVPPCGPKEQWNVLSSTERFQYMPKFAPPPGVHPAHLSSEERYRSGLVISSKRSRLNRISSKYRRIRSLSAIIESPRSQLGTSPVRSAVYIQLQTPSRARSNVVMEGINLAGSGLELIPNRRSINPELHVQARAALKSQISASSSGQRISQLPRAVRSRSMGSFLAPLPDHAHSNSTTRTKWSALHNRSASFGAQTVGPAPTGPLPPLPLRPALLRSLGVQAVASQPLYGSDTKCGAGRVYDTSQVGALHTFTPTRQRLEKVAPKVYDNDTSASGTQLLSPQSTSICVSTHPNTGKRDSVSSVASSLYEDINRLSIPTIETAERLCVSRVSSCNSLQSIGSLKIISTPTKRRQSGSRVNVYGSPAQRSKVLKAVSGNISTPRCSTSNLERPTSTPATTIFKFDELAFVIAKPSAMKGSPGSRKGHRRQNCVRISTLAPTVLGPTRSRSSSPFSMDGIREEGDETPQATKQPNGDMILRPRAMFTLNSPTKLRASLTSGSPTLFMEGWCYEQKDPVDYFYPPYSPYDDKQPLSRNSSMFSIPSFPSPTRVTADKGYGGGDYTTHDESMNTPCIDITRPSSEWTHDEDLSSSPPFALHVTPSASTPSLDGAECVSQSLAYDPAWPLLVGVYDPPASGQEYDPGHAFNVYSSSESSSRSNSPSPIDRGDRRSGFSGVSSARHSPSLAEGTRPDIAEKQGDIGESSMSPTYSPKPVSSFMVSSPLGVPTISSKPSPLGSHPTRSSSWLPDFASGSVSPSRPRRNSDKENEFPPAPPRPSHLRLPLAESLASPLEFAPVLKPTTRVGFCPPSSLIHQDHPASSVPIAHVAAFNDTTVKDQLPALPRKNSGRRSSSTRTNSRCRTQGARSPSPIGKNKPSSSKTNRKSLTGPRPPPAKDLRRSIMELRRKNSEIRFPPGLDILDDDAVSLNYDGAEESGQRKYLKLGREASPCLPFLGFGGQRDLGFDDLDVGIVVEDDLEAQLREAGGSGFDFGFDIRPLFISTTASSLRRGLSGVADSESEGGESTWSGSKGWGLGDNVAPGMMMVKESLHHSPSPSPPPHGYLIQDPPSQHELESEVTRNERPNRYGHSQRTRLPNQPPAPISPAKPHASQPRSKRLLTPIREASLAVARPASPNIPSPKTDTVKRPGLLQRGSSVWDDGEKYWQLPSSQPRPLPVRAEPGGSASSPSRTDSLRLPRNGRGRAVASGGNGGDLGNDVEGAGGGTNARGRGNWREGSGSRDLRTKKEKEKERDKVRGDGVGGGLYDEVGFLRSSPLRGI